MGVTKYILPVIVGAIVGMILIYTGETFIHFLFPFPPGADVSDPDVLSEYIHHLSDKAFLLLLINYAAGSFVAGAVATLTAKRSSLQPALVVGIVLTIGGIYNIITLPQPLWVSLFSMLIYLPFAYFGYLLTKKRG